MLVLYQIRLTISTKRESMYGVWCRFFHGKQVYMPMKPCEGLIGSSWLAFDDPKLKGVSDTLILYENRITIFLN